MQLSEVRRWRLSLFVFMFSVGFAMASWITRTPAIRDSIHASIAIMGLVLLGLSGGSMLGITSSGRLVRRFGTRPVIGIGAFFMAIGNTITAISTGFGTISGVFLGLFISGASGGLADIALNIDGSDVENRLGKPVMPALHGCFSLGSLVGAIVGIGLTAINFPVAWHLTIGVVLMGLISIWAYLGLPIQNSNNDTSVTEVKEVANDKSVWRDKNLLLLGVVLLALAFTEGAANDWLPLLVVDGLKYSAAQSSAVFAAFTAVMTIGRFTGVLLINRFGKQGVLFGSIITAAIGVLLVSLATQPILIILGVAFWGLGASLGFPVTISIAGDSKDRPEQRVSAVATGGYIAFLVGPPALGFLGQHYGLKTAILLVVAFLVVAAFAVTVRIRATEVKVS
ncbi:MAG: MFS transporter [Micrococcaceae bacterium]